VKIELTEAEADRSLHPHHSELWVRVLSTEPLGAESWLKVRSHLDAEQLALYREAPCGFYVDIWDDDSPDRDGEFGFEQWWVLPSKQGVSE
jgi:hypothetical protein